MRTATWIFTPALALALVACGDDKGDDATTTPMTSGNTTGTTPPGDDTTGAVDPTTGNDPSNPPDPSTTSGETGEPMTTEPETTGGSLSCDAYCATYATSCKDFNEYDNTEACLDQCNQWPVGDAAATDGDSLGCRTYHAGVAGTMQPEVHCPHAGPSGAGVCVDAGAPTCDGYCAQYFMNCVDDLNLYVDMADCLAQCAPWYPGHTGDTAGNSIGCRDYHAGVALGDPVLHCPHAGPGGADVCVFAP